MVFDEGEMIDEFQTAFLEGMDFLLNIFAEGHSCSELIAVTLMYSLIMFKMFDEKSGQLSY